MDDEEGDRADGDAGSEWFDADAEAEAEAAAAAAAEAVDFDGWGGDAGATLAAQAPLPAPAELWMMTVLPPWAAAQGDGSDGEEAELPRLPGSVPGAVSARAPASPTWLCRGCGHADTQLGDPVTLQCQHRVARQAGCCWHTACHRTAEERAVARCLLNLHSRYACPQHRRGVPPVGRGMGRHDDAEGGFNAVAMP